MAEIPLGIILITIKAVRSNATVPKNAPKAIPILVLTALIVIRIMPNGISATLQRYIDKK